MASGINTITMGTSISYRLHYAGSQAPMAQPFDAYEYLDFLLSRWRFVAAACAAAVVLTLAVSLSLPKKYTAISRIVIEPPAGSDPRATIAVSPIYLESLRTYEMFASSDD